MKVCYIHIWLPYVLPRGKSSVIEPFYRFVCCAMVFNFIFLYWTFFLAARIMHHLSIASPTSLIWGTWGQWWDLSSQIFTIHYISHAYFTPGIQKCTPVYIQMYPRKVVRIKGTQHFDLRPKSLNYHHIS